MNRQPATEPETELVPVPLTSYPGWETDPSFSPEGTQVAFQWCKEGLFAGENCDIYVKQIGVEPPFRLTSDPADDLSPAWSPDGNFIAFLRALPGNRLNLMLIPQRGGQERLLRRLDWSWSSDEALPPSLAWTPDSKWVVFPSGSDKTRSGLLMLSLETLEEKRLTTCPAGFVDTGPAFSPDGRTLSFIRESEAGEDIWLLRLGRNCEPQGTPERSSASRVDSRLAWMPDGEGIVFSSSNSLWRTRVSTSGNRRRLAFAWDATFLAPAISRRGNRLAYGVRKLEPDIWHLELRQPGLDPRKPSKLIESTGQDAQPAYSVDARRSLSIQIGRGLAKSGCAIATGRMPFD